MRMYQDEDGRLLTIGQLWDEFQDLKEMDPETYDYDFEQYIGNCTSKNGALTEVEARWYSFETMWVGVKDALRRYLKAADIYYELSGGGLFSHFEILATPEMREQIDRFLAEVA